MAPMFDPEVIAGRVGRGGYGGGGGTTASPLPTTVPNGGYIVPGSGTGSYGNAQQPWTARPPAHRRPPLAGPRNDLYGGYTAAQLAANPALVAQLGRAGAARWAGRPGTGGAGGASGAPGPSTPTPSPSAPPSGSPFTPVAGAPVGSPPLPSLPPPNPSSPTANGGNGGNDFLDPMMMFLSAVPAMRMNTTHQISDAMAQAGFTGNRWGTSAERTAGQIGAESGMQENALLQSLLGNYANNQENRALQATGQATGLGALLDQMAQSRVQLPFQVGQYEQGRQDNVQQQLFNDWQQNRLGWLGPMLQAAMSQGAGSPGSPGQVIQVPNNDASHGTVDWLTLLGGLFG